MVTFSDEPKVTFFGHKKNPGSPLFICIKKNLIGAEVVVLYGHPVYSVKRVW